MPQAIGLHVVQDRNHEQSRRSHRPPQRSPARRAEGRERAAGDAGRRDDVAGAPDPGAVALGMRSRLSRTAPEAMAAAAWRTRIISEPQPIGA